MISEDSATRRLPALRYVGRAAVSRAAALWLSVHLFLWIVSRGDIARLPALALCLLAVTAGYVTHAFARRNDEILFFANLGVGSSVGPLIAAGTIAGFELLLTVVLGALK